MLCKTSAQLPQDKPVLDVVAAVAYESCRELMPHNQRLIKHKLRARKALRKMWESFMFELSKFFTELSCWIYTRHFWGERVRGNERDRERESMRDIVIVETLTNGTN